MTIQTKVLSNNPIWMFPHFLEIVIYIRNTFLRFIANSP